MELRVNGEHKTLPQGLTINELLLELQIPAETLVVELNGTILQSADYPLTVLKEQDRLELIQFVGGG
ncbi:MAG: sulfur carrier protein ThiS [Desulfobulbaceae bacterium]|uniref:Sulfur carrier protein ThiS n=1 Tax=Candidatus Desulfatifera sulfidica TaxID=2841691 RepID=A0A8J6N8N0_9BACT|nr:sulfur carrier protein ThiS [Candidatus Desulfatifera sulfidica]